MHSREIELKVSEIKYAIEKLHAKLREEKQTAWLVINGSIGIHVDVTSNVSEIALKLGE